jgi:hypothetical protein
MAAPPHTSQSTVHEHAWTGLEAQHPAMSLVMEV